MSYDDAGQITSDGKFRSMQYQYDANGRMRWAARLDGTGATSATFDGGGQRVQTILNGSTRNFVYNISGQVVAEYRSGVLDREYIYQGGALLATDEQPRSCSLTTSTFVNNFYSGALNRQPNGSESSQWTTSLNQAMAQGFDPLLTQAQSLGQTLFTSAEYSNGSNTDFVTDLYWAYLQRGPDQGGLEFWEYQLNQGASRAAIRQEFAIGLEFQYKVAGVCSALGGAAAVKYVFMDHQGSTRALMDGNGTVLTRHDYLPFGEELWADTGMRTSAQQFGAMDQTRARYALTQKDEATGLEHTAWRKYENTSGRWTTPDPIGGNLANPQSFNHYTYAANDPINLIDPSGLEPQICMVDGSLVDCHAAYGVLRSGAGYILLGGDYAYTYDHHGEIFVGPGPDGDPVSLDVYLQMFGDYFRSLAENTPLPSDLRARVEARLKNPKSKCEEFTRGLIDEAARISSSPAFSNDAMKNFDRIGDSNFMLKNVGAKGQANFDGNQRVVHITPVRLGNSAAVVNHTQNGYAATALNEVVHHSAKSGVYSDRTMARATFNRLSAQEKAKHPLPKSNAQGPNSGYWHPLYLANCPGR